MPEICDGILLLPVGNYSFHSVIEKSRGPVVRRKAELDPKQGIKNKRTTLSEHRKFWHYTNFVIFNGKSVC